MGVVFLFAAEGGEKCLGTRARKFVKSMLHFNGSKRRERLGVDVHYWEEESWSARNVEMVWH